jgi:RimJ/RimL family protein N-acetyltransferase
MELSYRPATRKDLELLLAWRSQPKIYENFYLQEGALEWDEHVDWWNSREHRRDWIIVARADELWRDVGSVNVSKLDTDDPEVGVFVGEISAWGNGIATEAVEFALNWLRKRDFEKASARILEENEGSKAVFEKAGFRRTGPAREGEDEYEIEL